MAVMIASIFVVAMLFILSMPMVTAIWAITTPMLPVDQLPIMDLLNNACGWTLIILVVGTIIYGAVSAFRRDPVDVPGY